MEWLEGRDLEEELRTRRRLSPPEVLEVVDGMRNAVGGGRFDASWREPKILAIYEVCDKGEVDEDCRAVYDGTLGDCETLFSLLLGYPTTGTALSRTCAPGSERAWRGPQWNHPRNHAAFVRLSRSWLLSSLNFLCCSGLLLEPHRVMPPVIP